MKTRKAKKPVTKNKFSTVIDNTKNTARKLNGLALKTTEEVVTESLTIAEQWQGVTEKAVKGGFKLIAIQQDIIFDALDTFKSQFKLGRKRFHKIFA